MRRLVLLVSLALGCGDDGGAQMTPDAAPSPDAAPTTCDVLRTDQCTTNASRPKCSVGVSMGRLTTRCLEQNGNKAPGEACTRGSTAGVDDCDKGVWCSGLALPANSEGEPTMRICRSFCVDDTRCAMGELCLTFLLDPKVGYCLPTGCPLFSTDCPANTTCVAFNRYDETMYSGVCSPAGTVAAGGDCSQEDCVANVRCVVESPGKLVCHPYCDASHACAAGSCTLLPGMPNSGGFCP